MTFDLESLRARFDAHPWAVTAAALAFGAVAGLASRTTRGRAAMTALAGVAVELVAELASRRLTAFTQSWSEQHQRPFARA